MEGGFAAEDSTFRYIVGIDLGTTNSAVAYVDRTAPEPGNRRIRFLDVPQLVSPGSVAHRNVLPSFLYLPGAYELPPGSTALPWDAERDHAVGEFAREQGALVPGRLVASAKSWLCHAGVDRTAPILPWGASPDVHKVSPVEASTRYLQHIREAWNQAMARGREGAALEEQLIILTVPASFDEIARELTLKAAHQAGLPRVVLLEEPLAAFYAWISGHVPAPVTAESGFSEPKSGPSTVEANFAASPSPDPSHQVKRLPENTPKSPFTTGGLAAPPIATGGLAAPPSTQGRLPAPPFSTGGPPAPSFAKGELLAPPFTKGGSGGIFPTGVTQELNFQTAPEGSPVPCPAPGRSTALGMVPGQLILVCDVGGGTTDFTVIVVRAGKGGPRFDRLAVGDHLMLGGDNMDLTIARSIETRLFGQPGKLDSKRWHQLCHQCRKAKETLLADPEHRQIDVIVVGTGGKLIGDTLKETVTLEKVEELILEGFFPNVALDDLPHGNRRTGLTEFGLPYVQDPAVTRHLAAFWQRHLNLLRDETSQTNPRPDYLLFNGGALTPEAIRTRIARVVQGWFQKVAGDSWAPRELHNPRPELAVAVGAAYYGLVKQGEGLRVGAGSPRAYYVEVTTGETPQGVPGEQTGRAAVCLAPRGVEEGFETLLKQPAFELITNQPVAFQLLSSSTRLGDRLGDLVVLTEEETSILPPIRTVLRYGKKGTAKNIPVRLAIRLTEIGTLELWCQSLESPHRWQLQFDVRSPQEGNVPAGVALPAGETLDSRIIEEARERLRAVYRKGAATAVPSPDKLVKELTAVLEMGKEQWPAPLIRQLADALLECQESRGLSPHHEARWFNLLGFCLRPGFGDAVDDWRLKEVWKLYPRGIQFPRQAQCRLEWWVFWRRVAGGLTAGQQWHIYQQLSPTLPGVEGKQGKATKSPKKLSPQEWFEVMMALANFERLPVETKVALGRLLLQNIRNVNPKPQELWAISRLGARAPFYGPLDRVIPAKEVAGWLERLCSSGLQPSAELGQAIVQLARRTGDRERDLQQHDLERALQWLERLSDTQRFIKPLRNVLPAIDEREQSWIFGESLPSGLVLSSPSS